MKSEKFRRKLNENFKDEKIKLNISEEFKKDY